MNAEPHFKKIALIGFGLIGGSIARAARAQGLAGEIVTTARSEKTRARVAELGIVEAAISEGLQQLSDYFSRHPGVRNNVYHGTSGIDRIEGKRLEYLHDFGRFHELFPFRQRQL